MSRPSRRFAPALLAAFAFLLVNAAPASIDMLGVAPAFAKKGGNGGGNGGGGGNGNGGGKSNKGNKSASAGGASNGKSSTAPGKAKLSGTAFASANAKVQGTKTPKSIVRQYVLANGLKQGDVASLLKSWNSLNRNEQAYLNNMDNPNSLPGLQIAYIRENMNAGAALAAFESLGGSLANPPTETDLLAAQDALAAEAVLDAQAVLDAPIVLDEYAADPLSHTDEEFLAAQAVVDGYAGGAAAAQTVVDGYTGDDPQTVVDGFAAAYSFDAQTVIDQFNAFTDYQGAEALAEDAFLAASVSYKGELYDEAVFGDLRETVDAIVAMKGLDTLVADFDAAAEPIEPQESTDSTEPEIILPE
jgi:hypothetical protein